MGDKKDELEEKVEENSNEEEKTKSNANKLLNTLLAIIVIITVGCGATIYYSLYKYSKNDPTLTDDNTVKDEVATVADIIDTALNTNTVEENVVENTSVSVGNTTVTTGEADNRKVLNESIIVLYKGLILDIEKMGLVELKYIDNSNPSKDNYVITYYN